MDKATNEASDCPRAPSSSSSDPVIVPTPGGDALKEKWQAAVHAYADGKGTVGALMKAGADLLTRIEALEAEKETLRQSLLNQTQLALTATERAEAAEAELVYLNEALHLLPTATRADRTERLRELFADIDKGVAAEARVQPEVCICAAIRLPDGRVIRGHWHHNCFAAISELATVDASIPSRQERFEQGFVTSRNRFVDRKEGLALQLAAGIPSADPVRKGYGNQLFSEDLY